MTAAHSNLKKRNRLHPPGWDYFPSTWSQAGWDAVVKNARHDASGQAVQPSTVTVAFAGLSDDEVDGTKVMLRRIPIWGGSDAQVDAKIRILTEKVVRPALVNYLPWTRGLVSTILAHAPSKVDGHHKREEARTFYEWARQNIRYVNDPTDEELFTELPVLMKRRIGDCDDFAVLLAVLFKAAGIRAGFRVIQPRGAKSWAHIYTLGFIGGKWVPYDATEPFWPGWEYPNPVRVRDYEVTNG